MAATTSPVGLARKFFATPAERRWRYAKRRVRSEVRTAYYRLRYPNVRFGPGTRVAGRLVVKGRGRVVFGARCDIDGADILVPGHESVVGFGDDCYVNGPEIRAEQSVTFGDRCIIGSALVLDTDFHSTSFHRHRHDARVRIAPVVVEDDVWLGARTSVLPGTRIGRGSVIAVNTVVHRDVPAGKVIAPSPMTEIGNVPDFPDFPG